MQSVGFVPMLRAGTKPFVRSVIGPAYSARPRPSLYLPPAHASKTPSRWSGDFVAPNPPSQGSLQNVKIPAITFSA